MFARQTLLGHCSGLDNGEMNACAEAIYFGKYLIYQKKDTKNVKKIVNGLKGLKWTHKV
jgi:hypothetical protein